MRYPKPSKAMCSQCGKLNERFVYEINGYVFCEECYNQLTRPKSSEAQS